MEVTVLKSRRCRFWCGLAAWAHVQVPSRAVPLVLESLNPAVTAPASEYSANMTWPVHAAIKPLIAG